MTADTRQKILAVLTDGWGQYVVRFQALTPIEQERFLDAQGYFRLADLLAHILAWWEEGIVAVRRLLTNPESDLPDYDVDGFNFINVRRFKTRTDEEVIERFEALREEMIELVSTLPDEAFGNERLVARLRVEVMEHLDEHALREEDLVDPA